ncbi:hypothetical protein DB31_6947 [Hyalangium minutum]|uniref:Uncharacterized protein n=1 Tax=Hyalangium minutum TaxID=394096 RepID=A0A085WMY2_9BACT|nr:hypothetical protein DB31_6947 [Hyalangium minutum]
MPKYRALAHLLEPFFYEERFDWFAWWPPGGDNLRRWMRRLCSSSSRTQGSDWSGDA